MRTKASRHKRRQQLEDKLQRVKNDTKKENWSLWSGLSAWTITKWARSTKVLRRLWFLLLLSTSTMSDVACSRWQRSASCATAKGVDDDNEKNDILGVVTNRPTLIDNTVTSCDATQPTLVNGCEDDVQNSGKMSLIAYVYCSCFCEV